MDEAELDGNIEEEAFEDSSYQACYIYRFGYKHHAGSNERPSKKRRLNASTTPANCLKLSTENDSERLAATRQRLFEEIWTRQAVHFRDNNVDRKSLKQLSAFLASVSLQSNTERLPTALLLTGLDATHYNAVLSALTTEVYGHHDAEFRTQKLVVNLQSSQCPNLQTALKNVIKLSISEYSGNDAYTDFLTKHKRLLPLNFDLELLQQFCTNNELSQVVVSLANVETFDAQVLNELVSTLRFWLGRIPFVLALGITSTKELFESRLSKTCLKLIRARSFNFAPHASLHSDILRLLQQPHSDTQHPLLGPNIISTLNDLEQSQGFSAQSLSRVLKVIYLSHFLVNPISIFCHGGEVLLAEEETRYIARAARRTDSFQSHCDDLLAKTDESANARVRALLEDDKYLIQEVMKEVSAMSIKYSSAVSLISFLADLYDALSPQHSSLRRPKLEVEAQLYHTMHDLSDCAVYDELESCIKSTTLEKLLRALKILRMKQIATTVTPDLNQAIEECERPTLPYRDGAAAVNGGETQDSLPAHQRAHNKPAKTTKTSKLVTNGSTQTDSILERVWVILTSTLQQASFDVSSVLLHEAFILSTRAIRIRQTLEPQPRTALERALLKPGDYLGCECCSARGARDQAEAAEDEEQNSRKVTHGGHMPPACILFNLLQEAPTIINVRDLFDAFRSRFEPVKDSNNTPVLEGEDTVSRATMAQFYRTLTELRMIGLIKASTGLQIKKRISKASKSATQEIDFVAKTSWAGL
ncbi:Origin recognition complex subunit 3 [Lithohypha guttulata]|uniref:Origin recognition complex subunit 3 n=1 Tax=Lithohypha guttulata TaxID=1690604 RepID=UPI002DDF2305|nr:Origin recognition complex subunit 3 [Lithohypha guttulata]KAK5106139.1 Origin recognition complex subunit 3 [Lithohypha guttulata]